MELHGCLLILAQALEYLAESFDPFTEPYLDDPYAFWRIAR